jgi:hypothetical protein
MTPRKKISPEHLDTAAYPAFELRPDRGVVEVHQEVPGLLDLMPSA